MSSTRPRRASRGWTSWRSAPITTRATRALSPPDWPARRSCAERRRSAGRSGGSVAEPSEGPQVYRGAEAKLRRVDWWGFPALVKERDAKNYRPKALDERLRRERTRTEARLLVDARRLGIRTPLLYDIDLLHHR